VIRGSGDAYPSTKLKSNTGYIIGLLDTNQINCMLAFHVAAPENHRATRTVLEYTHNRMHEAVAMSARGELRTTVGGDEFKISAGLMVACNDWPMAAKQLKCVSPQSIFKGFMLQQTSRDYAPFIGQTVLDMTEKHINFEKRLRLARERQAKELQLDGVMGLSAEQRARELKDWEQAERNPQLGQPSAGSEFPLHDMLHAKPGVVKKNAKAIAALFPDFSSMLQSHKPLENFACDLKKGEKLNMTGSMASWYFRNFVRLIKPLLTQERSSKNAMLLTHSVIFVKVRDIIGSVMTTTKHNEQTVQKIADLGKEALNLHLLVFTGDDVLPYLACLCLDLPVQLKFILQACNERNIDFDSSSINAQQMELCNKVCKLLVHTLSNHKHITGEEKEQEKHYQSETFRVFLYEYIVKVLARKLGFEKTLPAMRSDKQKVLPEGNECKLCGLDLEQDPTVHDFFCQHPLLEPLLATAREGKLHADIQALLTPEAVAPILLQPAEPTKNIRQKHVKAPKSAAQVEQAEKKKEDRRKTSEWKKKKQETV
jgi:hypothetical protein